MATADAREQRLRALHGSIKLLLAIGLAFLLVPFVASLPWPSDELPADATLVEIAPFAAGSTRAVTLGDGSTAWVTRGSAALAARLQAFPADGLWFPSAPGLADQDWFVLRGSSELDEPLRHLPAAGAWPGGFVADSGAAWDLAGRALKPWPGHPGGLARKVQNLRPLPWLEREGRLILRPLPAPPPMP